MNPLVINFMKLTGKNRRKQNKDVMYSKKTFSKLLQNFFSHVQEFDEPTKIKSKVHAFVVLVVKFTEYCKKSIKVV